MDWRKFGVIGVLLGGCAGTADYQKADGPVNEKDQALAICRNEALPYAGTGLIAIAAYQSAIQDCMRVKGYVPKS